MEKQVKSHMTHVDSKRTIRYNKVPNVLADLC